MGRGSSCFSDRVGDQWDVDSAWRGERQVCRRGRGWVAWAFAVDQGLVAELGQADLLVAVPVPDLE